jgi:hypothetical protein
MAESEVGPGKVVLLPRRAGSAVEAFHNPLSQARRADGVLRDAFLFATKRLRYRMSKGLYACTEGARFPWRTLIRRLEELHARSAPLEDALIVADAFRDWIIHDLYRAPRNGPTIPTVASDRSTRHSVVAPASGGRRAA